jgi:flagellar protein FliL
MANEENAVETKKKSGLIKWILLGVILLLLGGGGYFAYNKFLAGPSDETSQEQGVAPDAQDTKKPVGTKIVSLPTFLVNLADPLGRRYLKLTMDVEVAGDKTAADLDKNMSKVRDAVILLLSSKTYADLASLENKQLLKMEIVNQLNLILETSNIQRVYFTEMVIQ